MLDNAFIKLKFLSYLLSTLGGCLPPNPQEADGKEDFYTSTKFSFKAKIKEEPLDIMSHTP